MAPDQALTIPDILHSIFSQASQDEDHAGGRELLARSARVCKTFQEAALPILWREVTILPFLRLCSSFKIDEGLRGDCGRFAIYSLTEEISTHERERLLWYGQYAQSVWCMPRPGAWWWVIGSSTWDILRNALQDTTLFPNLQGLHWEFDVAAPCALLQCLPPSARQLHIGCHNIYNARIAVPEWQAGLEALFRDLAGRPHQLQSFRFEAQSEVRFPSKTLAHLHGLHSLRELDVFAPKINADYDFIQRLTHLDLERLDVGFGVDASAAVGSKRALMFPSLTHLRVHAYPDDGLVFDRFVSSTLLELEIKEYCCADGSAWGFLRSCSAWARSYPSLRVLRVACRGPWEEDPAGPAQPLALSRVVAPLLESMKLHDFSLTWAGRLPPLNVQDDDLVAMSNAWPELVSLQLDVAKWDWLPEKIELTTQSLSALATRCPNLNMLALPYFVSRLQDKTELGNLPALGHDLEFLSLGHKVVADMRVLVEFLDRTFPYLDAWWWAVVVAD